MFKSIFKNTKNKRLYKIIFKTNYSSYGDKHTLLVTGVNPTDALENFYKKAGRDVKDILEFTEIKYSMEGTDIQHEQIR